MEALTIIGWIALAIMSVVGICVLMYFLICLDQFIPAEITEWRQIGLYKNDGAGVAKIFGKEVRVRRDFPFWYNQKTGARMSPIVQPALDRALRAWKWENGYES